MSLFKRNKFKFVQVRSANTAAIHIATFSASQKFEAALCGYNRWVATNSVQEVTVSKVLDSLPFQHEGWFWCKECISQLTATPVGHLTSKTNS